MNDLTLTYSGEFMLTSVVGETESGVEFVDGWLGRPAELIVVDSGWIIVKRSGPLEAAAMRAGLTVDHARAD